MDDSNYLKNISWLMPVGTVKWFDSENGYGFIEQENGEDLIFHRDQVTGEIQDGELVEFEIGEDERGSIAISVQKPELSKD